MNIFRESTKIKEKLATCEKVIVEQKEKNKQLLLKLAVYEQKEKKHQQETKDWSEERNKIENQLQRERGLNIQSAQQFTVTLSFSINKSILLQIFIFIAGSMLK